MINILPVVDSFLNYLSLEKTECDSDWTEELTASLSEIGKNRLLPS